MPTPHDDEGVGGVELASEPITTVNGLLMASLVRLSSGLNVELGLYSIEEGGFGPPRRPLLFPVQNLDAVRGVAETAVEKLPTAELDEEGVALLAHDRDLISTAIQAPNATLFTLAAANGSALVHLPVGDAAAVVRVLSAAELALVDLGVLSRPGRLN